MLFTVFGDFANLKLLQWYWENLKKSHLVLNLKELLSLTVSKYTFSFPIWSLKRVYQCPYRKPSLVTAYQHLRLIIIALIIYQCWSRPFEWCCRIQCYALSVLAFAIVLPDVIYPLQRETMGNANTNPELNPPSLFPSPDSAFVSFIPFSLLSHSCCLTYLHLSLPSWQNTPALGGFLLKLCLLL